MEFYSSTHRRENPFNITQNNHTQLIKHNNFIQLELHLQQLQIHRTNHSSPSNSISFNTLSSLSFHLNHTYFLFTTTNLPVEPAIVFQYLNAFWKLLSKYLNPNNAHHHITPNLIQTNSHLVHQLIHLTAPTKENPYGKNYSQQQQALIEEIIQTKSKYLSKLISEATETLLVKINTNKNLPYSHPPYHGDPPD
ncbi:hypothetical protein VP01_1129g1 [Puccinia sorghi]|uniref:Uncharacterized protein n=1 Tax=Puccinia sorghi TaxID=27349 RepID=A0A0L6VS76_9BASI|nr:hypothetical protein VP01_1129g1 [Puccinia sorghi]